MIIYINTGIIRRSVHLFFWLQIRSTIFAQSEEGRNINFPPVLLGNSMERYLNEEYSDEDWWLHLKNSYSKLWLWLRGHWLKNHCDYWKYLNYWYFYTLSGCTATGSALVWYSKGRMFVAHSVQQVLWFAACIAERNTRSSGGTALCRVWGVKSQLDLPSLTHCL